MRTRIVAMLAAVIGVSGCGGEAGILESFAVPTTQSEFEQISALRAPEDAPSGVVYSLPRVLLPITLSRQLDQSNGVMSLNLAYGKFIFTPDQDYTFVLNYKHDSVSDDQIFIETTQNGLLTKISTTSQDQSFGVATGIVRLAGEVAKGLASGGFGAVLESGGGAFGRTQSFAPQPFDVTLIVDPTTPDLTQVVEETLALYGVQGVTMTAIGLEDVGERRSIGELREFCRVGACYRRAAPVVLQAFDSVTGTGAALTVEVPNHGVVGRVDFQRRAFVENKATAEFDLGMLTKISYVDPSEANKAANAPVDIAKAIFSIPGEMLKSESDSIEAERRLLNARAALLRDQAALLREQEKFRQTQEELQ